MRRAVPLLALLVLGGCDEPAAEGPIAVTVIGDGLDVVDPSQRAIDTSTANMLAETAQGLIRFDGAGQVEAGLAIRWDVSDDGLYYTFRLADGVSIDAEEAARRLRAAMGPTSRNPLKPMLDAIVEIVAVTPEVIEIRLSTPRPHLLELLAQPELALIGKDGGTGPFRIAARDRNLALLDPVAIDPEEEVDAAEAARRQVRLSAERAAIGVARFVREEVALVIGGTIADLPVARAATLPREALRFDPAAGLFGLHVVEASGFLAASENRRALAMAIDRDRIATTIAIPGWLPATTVLPSALDSLPAPARPDWAGLPIDLRRQLARTAIAEWGEAPPLVRVSLPDGPGSRLLFALIRADWARIGVAAVAVPWDDDADLRLVDAVAPAASPLWYLQRFACIRNVACSAEADTAVAENRLPDADAALTVAHAFIAIGMPVRWSLVSPALGGFQPNARSVHPLGHLRDP